MSKTTTPAHKTYVAVKCDGTVRYVTSIKGTEAFWEDGKVARAFPDHLGVELVTYLRMNGYDAVMIKSPKKLCN